MEKDLGGGGEFFSDKLYGRADIGTYCQNVMAKIIAFESIFSLFAPSILTNKLILFF